VSGTSVKTAAIFAFYVSSRDILPFKQRKSELRHVK
jgi:hypothetical protein